MNVHCIIFFNFHALKSFIITRWQGKRTWLSIASSYPLSALATVIDFHVTILIHSVLLTYEHPLTFIHTQIDLIYRLASSTKLVITNSI